MRESERESERKCEREGTFYFFCLTNTIFLSAHGGFWGVMINFLVKPSPSPPPPRLGFGDQMILNMLKSSPAALRQVSTSRHNIFPKDLPNKINNLSLVKEIGASREKRYAEIDLIQIFLHVFFVLGLWVCIGFWVLREIV